MNHRIRPSLLFTCEHASNRVPPSYQYMFVGHEERLASHRGWDPGTLPLGRQLAAHFDAPLIATAFTRLLIEPNRSRHHRDLFSDLTRQLPAEEKQQLVDACYTPHRDAVIAAIERMLNKNQRVIHIGVHSFTPILNGETRHVDVGLLYDPQRADEKKFCRDWADALHSHAPDLRVRMNQPYRGNADGLTTSLRRQFPPAGYIGLELEVNQNLLKSTGKAFVSKLSRAVIDSLTATIA